MKKAEHMSNGQKKKKGKKNKRRSNKMEVNLNERDRTVMKVDEGEQKGGRKRVCARGAQFSK